MKNTLKDKIYQSITFEIITSVIIHVIIMINAILH